MRFRILNTGALLALAIAGGIALPPAPTRADNNITYNFNEPNGRELGWVGVPDASGTVTPFWDWNLDQSSVGGGWQAFSGTNAANSAAYFVSPCFVIDNVQDWVNFKVDHRFSFPLSGTTANQLGQVQYRVDMGSGWGAWSGIPTEYFVKPNGGSTDNKPNYGPPLFAPLVETSGTLPVQAWADTTLNFASGFHVTSEFTLFYDDFNLQDGYDIQFRFAMANDVAVSGTNTLVWEVNKVQIEGVRPCVIPEPGTLALAGIGGLGCLLVARRRRRVRAARAVVGSTAATIVVVIVTAAVIATATPARAESTSWNFQTGNGGWIATGTWGPFLPEPDYQWKWVTSSTVSGGTSPHWAVRAQGVSPSFPAASFLTSPTFSTLVSSTAGLLPAQAVRISLAHDFFLMAGTTNGIPTTLGQLQYRLNPVNGNGNGNGAWSSLPLSYFTNGGSVLVDNPVFGPSPFKSGSTTIKLVDQTEFVAPNYLTPNGGGALPYVTPASAAFTGMSPGWPTAYVPSQGFITGTALVPVAGITSMQLRLTNLNLSSNCSPTDGWNVRFVQVDYVGDDQPIPPVPEPGALALGATGLAALAAAGMLRHRRHQRPSRPNESP